MAPDLMAQDGYILTDVGKTFARRDLSASWVLANINLTIEPDEFVVILGPSGCGKSTLLRIMAGILRPSEGTVESGTIAVTGPSRDRGMIFQSADSVLFDWLTVEQNVGFGLKAQRVRAPERRTRVLEYLSAVGLQSHGNKYPHELSGGMKQRVQLARTLVTNPTTVFFDEPFAALDAQTRRMMQDQLVEIWSKDKKSYIYVTHDIRESVLLGQRILIMSAPPRSKVSKEYNIELPYPRDPHSQAFQEYERSVEADIQQEVSKLWA